LGKNDDREKVNEEEYYGGGYAVGQHHTFIMIKK